MSRTVMTFNGMLQNLAKSFPEEKEVFRPVSLRFRPVGLRFRLVGLRFRPVGLRFRPQGLRFRPVGLRFRPVGLRSSVFVFGSSFSTHPSERPMRTRLESNILH